MGEWVSVGVKNTHTQLHTNSHTLEIAGVQREELFTAKEHIEHKELGFIIHDRCSFYVILVFFCGK